MTSLTRPDRLEPTSCGSHAVKAPAAPSWSALLNELLAAINTRREQRAAIAALRRMDERELRDIGIGRMEIEAAVRGEIRRGRR